jgi:hypothetical protein
VLQRRIGGDAGAQQGRGRIQRDAVGDGHDIVLVDHDGGGIAALGDRLAGAGRLGIGRAIGLDHAGHAILLLALAAGRALAAAVDHAADADPVADLEAADIRAHRRHHARDLVTRHDRIGRVAQVVLHDVQVGVADARVLDLDGHIVRARIAPVEVVGRQRGGAGRGGEGAGGDGHGSS